MSKTLILFALIVFVLKYDLVDSACCGPPCSRASSGSRRARLCNDCTRTTPNCGYGKCNIFACACKGGCRKGVGCDNCRVKRSIGEEDDISNVTLANQTQQGKIDTEKHLDMIFGEFDTNKNGVLEFTEAQEWGLKHHAISKRDAHMIMKEFVKIDSDKDGKLARHEIDK